MKILFKKSNENRVLVAVTVKGKNGPYASHRWKNPSKALEILKETLKLNKDTELTFKDKRSNKVLTEEELIDAYMKSDKRKPIQKFVKDRFVVSKGNVEPNIDPMGKREDFTYRPNKKETLSLKAHESELMKGLYKQTNDKNAQGMEKYIASNVEKLFGNNRPTNIVITNDSFKTYGGYMYDTDTLFIRASFYDEKVLNEIISRKYFALQSRDDATTHEYAHKVYWDRVKTLYNSNKTGYNNLDDAATYYEKEFKNYIIKQTGLNRLYIVSNISYYAYIKAKGNNYREAFA